MEDNRQIKKANSFLKDQLRQLSPDYLAIMRDQNSVEARDVLREIAEKYNVHYTAATTGQELYDKIIIAMEQEADNEK